MAKYLFRHAHNEGCHVAKPCSDLKVKNVSRGLPGCLSKFWLSCYVYQSVLLPPAWNCSVNLEGKPPYCNHEDESCMLRMGEQK